MGDAQIRIFHGPNVCVPFRAAVAQWGKLPDERVSANTAAAYRLKFGDHPLWADGEIPETEVDYLTLVGAVAAALHPPDLPPRLLPGEAGEPSRIALESADPQTSALVLRTAIEAAQAVFAAAAGRRVAIPEIGRRLAQVRAQVRLRLPRSLIGTLVSVAGRRGIPVYPVAAGSEVWLYGQGSAGIRMFWAASEPDSPMGVRLSRDKALSNRLVVRAGFPGVVHATARTPDEAVAIADRIGYPVVAKPLERGMGVGVTTGIRDRGTLLEAFRIAGEATSRGVLVERHVEGIDHRLSVFGGRLAWASARFPPAVVGDGRSTILELIGRENAARSRVRQAGEGLKPIVVDDGLRRHLSGQGQSLEDRPSPGESVRLRGVANTAQGGTFEDVTSRMHSDNRDLAETLARVFRLDAIGVDLIIADIGQSWRGQPCAVIEVNATQGIGCEAHAEIILARRFPGKTQGRIPSVVLIDCPGSVRDTVVGCLVDGGLRVGEANGRRTRLAGQDRPGAGRPLAAGVRALLLDPACDAIVIEATAEEILDQGFPLDRCDLVLGGSSFPEDLRTLVAACAAAAFDRLSTARDAESRIRENLEAVLCSAARNPCRTRIR